MDSSNFYVNWDDISYCTGWVVSESGFEESKTTKCPSISTICIKDLDDKTWSVFTPKQESTIEFSTVVMPLGNTIPDSLRIGNGQIGQNKDGTYIAFIPVQESIKELEALKKEKELNLHFNDSFGLNKEGFFDINTGELMLGKVLGKDNIGGTYYKR